MPIPLRKSLAAAVVVLALAQAAFAAAPDQKSTTLPAKKFAPQPGRLPASPGSGGQHTSGSC